MKVALLGHSQTRHLIFDKFRVKKFYKAGATFRSISNSIFFQRLIAYKPDLVFILLGSNYIIENHNQSTVSNIVGDYLNLKEEISNKINPTKGIYLLDIEKRTKDNKYSTNNIYRKIRNAVIKNIKKIDKESFIPFKPVSGLLESDISSDGIHVNERGARKIANTVQNKIQEILN